MRIALSMSKMLNKREGITRFASEVYNELKKTGYAIHGEAVIGLKHGMAAFRKGIDETFPGLKVKILKTNIPTRFLFAFYDRGIRVPFSFNRLWENDKDVKIFFHNFIPDMRKTDYKKIIVIHDLTPLHECRKQKIRERFKRRYQRIVDYADVIFTVSQYSKQDIIRNVKVNPDKIIVNYCGVDYDRFSKDIDVSLIKSVKDKYKLPDRYLLFVGQPRTNKNIEGLLNGYALLSKELKENYKIVLANSNRKIHELIDKLGIKSGVIELKGIEEKDIAVVYKAASVLALISFFEGFGLPMVEAMAAGVPTLISNVSCMPEVSGGASLICNPYDYKDISDKMKIILCDDNIRKELIKKGKIRAKEFSWQSTGRKFVNVIDELMHNE